MIQMTKTQFTRKAEAAFKRANPDAEITMFIWRRKPRIITYPTGVKGWWGKFVAYSKTHRPRVMLAEGDDTYVMVR